jgi:tRNA dimethylallyltransferase
MRIATGTGGLVVNADSMQVYKELRILTARPSEADEAAVSHRLYGIRTATEPYSVASWLEDMRPLVTAARAGGPRLVIVGGTGLYFRVLLEGLSPVPEIPKEIREFWRSEAVAKGSEALHEVLRGRDPQMAARLRPSDPQRVTRALEVVDATGRSLADWQAEAGEPMIRTGEAAPFCVCPPRAELYRRCDVRLDAMIEAGALEEVKRLRELRFDSSLPLMRALGVRPFLAFVDGRLAWEAALVAAKTETRQYAKRQLTWMRRNMISWDRISET